MNLNGNEPRRSVWIYLVAMAAWDGVLLTVSLLYYALEEFLQVFAIRADFFT